MKGSYHCTTAMSSISRARANGSRRNAKPDSSVPSHRSSALMPDDAEGAGTAGLLQLVLDLEPQFVDRVRRKLFAKVVFANETARTPHPLAGAEDIVFERLEPQAVYEVLL